MTTRALLLSALLTVLAILALIRWPGPTLAVVCLGIPLGILVKAWMDMHWEAKRYQEEHDLK